MAAFDARGQLWVAANELNALVRISPAGEVKEAARNGARLPVTALVDQFYGDVQRRGGNRWDTSSLIARLTSRKPGPS